MTREQIIEACAEAAHEAWLAEKVRRLRDLDMEMSWLAENGEEQLVSWEDLSEPVRDFDRIVVGAIIDTMVERGIVKL